MSLLLKVRPWIGAPALLLVSLIGGYMLVAAQMPIWSFKALAGAICFSVVLFLAVYIVLMKFSDGYADPLAAYWSLISKRFFSNGKPEESPPDSPVSLFSGKPITESRFLPDQRLLTFYEGESPGGFSLRALELEEEIVLELGEKLSLSKLTSRQGLSPTSLSSTEEFLDRKLLSEAARLMDRLDGGFLPGGEELR